MDASKKLGLGVRIVSMPCAERFERQTAEYKEFVLPKSCRKRVSIEAGSTPYWSRYVGLDGIALGIDRFGMSAPGNTIMKEFGMTSEHLVNAAESLR